MMHTATALSDTQVTEPPAAQDGQSTHDRPWESIDAPSLAANVLLAGEMQDTGFTDRQWLIERGGQFIQVSELLYRVAEHANGERTYAQIADAVTAVTDWIVTAEHAWMIIHAKLVPMGILTAANTPSLSSENRGSEQPGSSTLAVNLRMKVVGPRAIEPIARVLQVLFAPVLLVPILAAAAAAHWWLYVGRGGVMEGFIQVVYTPWLAFPVLALTFISGIFHEFGHAAALRYGGGRARGMGVGLYLIFPAFYTDTTETYRLGRWARVRTALGGFYFHLIFALGTIALYLVTRQEFLLLVVLLINVDIVRQSLPFVRFDGYWALADLTGIPDFFSQMGAFLRRILPVPRWKGSKLPHLKPWVQAVFVSYILVTGPVLAFLFSALVRGLPRLMLTAVDSLRTLAEAFAVARQLGDVPLMAAYAMQMLLLTLQMLAPPYLLYVWVRGPVQRGWRWSAVTPARRAVGATAGIAGVVVLALLWWPQMQPAGTTARASMPDGVQRFNLGIQDRAHVPYPVAYPQTPPVGGAHALYWQNCGFYDTAVGNETAVHAMEHGAVWITYRPDLPAAQIARLRELAAQEGYLLISPYPDLPASVVASAWGHQLSLNSAEDPRLGSFIRAFQNSEQAPERGGPCTGGVGTPQ